VPGVRPVTGKADVASYLSLRSSASTGAARLAKIPKNGGMTVLMVFPSSTWLKVSYSGKTGYVLSHYVIVGGKAAYKAGTATASSLNVRSGTSNSKSILGVLKSGQTVLITSSVKSGGTTWYKVLYGAGYGYVDSRYMRKQGS
jgi:D-alanyl-D-alanine carboxypeptidase